jgi:hypothetical protein
LRFGRGRERQRSEEEEEEDDKLVGNLSSAGSLVSAKNNDGELEILLAVGEQIKQRRRCIEQKNQPWPTAEGEQREEERLGRRARRWCGRAAAAWEAMAEEQQRGKLRRASEWRAGRSEEESGDGEKESGDGRSAGCVGISSRGFLQNSPCVILSVPEGVVMDPILTISVHIL